MDKTDQKVRKQDKYNRENTKVIPVRLNLKTDKDIIERLDQVSSKQGYIKELIRKDILDK